MQHRNIGRPSGTDGSDFSFRMLVDSRYTKVAKGKSHLHSLLLIQIIIYLIGLPFIAFSSSNSNGLNRVAISSVLIGFISLVIGEIGRRRSRATLLKVYTVASSIATLLSVFCVIRSTSRIEVIQKIFNSKASKFELIELARILIGLLVQIITTVTTVRLIGNMSPPKKSS